MSNKTDFKNWLDNSTTKAQTPTVPNTLYKTAYSKNITTEEWNALLSYLNKAIAKTNSWLTGFQESYDSIPDLSVLYNLKDNTIPLWDTSKQVFVNSTIGVFDGLLKIANSLDKARMDIDKNSFTVYTEDNSTGTKFKLPDLGSSVAEVSLLTDALPIRTGSGANSVVVNDVSGETANVACSENTSAFGTGNAVGLKGYYWSSIEFTDTAKTITLSTAHTGGEPVTCQYVAGDVISIVNNNKYESCSTITAVTGNVVTVDDLPFTTVYAGGEDFEDYTIYCPEKPLVGAVDLGKNSTVFGSGNKVQNAYAFSLGKGNTNLGMYSTIIGLRNKAGYGSFVQGVDNVWNGQKGAAFGEKLIGSGNRMYSVGYNNTHEAGYTYSAGTGNTLKDSLDFVIGVNNVVSGTKAFVLGEANDNDTAFTTILGHRNTVHVTDSLENTSTYNTTVIGSSNTVTRKWSGVVGCKNTNNSFGGYSLGLGLTTPQNGTTSAGLPKYTPYQLLLGHYNATTGMGEETARRITGGGAPGSSKTLETLDANGNLNLAGSKLTLHRSINNGTQEVPLTAESLYNLNQIIADTNLLGGVWTYDGNFKALSVYVERDLKVTRNVEVAGNFTVTGTTTVKDVKNLAVEDLTITLGKNLQGLGASLAGLVVPDYNGMQQPGGLFFDDTGTAYVGDVDRASDGTVSIGNAKPIAVRSIASEWSDNNIPRWNTAFEGFEPSVFTTDSFVQKSTDTTNYYLYARAKGTETAVKYSVNPYGSCIPMYDVGGILRVGAATEDGAAVNLKQLTNGWVKQLSGNTTQDRLYANKKGTEGYIAYSVHPTAGCIPVFDPSGVLKTSSRTSGTATNDCINYGMLKTYAVKKGTAVLKQTTTRPAVYGTESGVDKTFRVDVDGENADGYNNTIPIRDNNGILYASNSFSNEDGVDDREVANIGSIKKLAVPLPENQTPTVGQTLEVSSVVDGSLVMSWANPPKAVRHWLATLVKASDPDVNGGQIEFWSTGTPDSETNPTNFSDLFAKRIGKALVRNIESSNNEYFVYMLSVGGLTGVQYYTAYPFAEMNTSGVTYDSVTLTELT